MNENGINITLEELASKAELPKASKTSAFGYEKIEIGVSVTSELKHVAEVLSYAIAATGMKHEVTANGIEHLLVYLVYLRILQLRNSLPKGISASRVETLDFFAPFLAAIADAETPLSAYRFECVPDSECLEKGNPEGDGKGEVMFCGFSMSDVDTPRRVLELLKASGLRTSIGLPRIVSTNATDLLRIRMDESGDLLVAGPEVAETDLLVRSVINMTFVPKVWGEARTRYVNIGDYRPSLSLIVRRGLTG